MLIYRKRLVLFQGIFILSLAIILLSQGSVLAFNVESLFLDTTNQIIEDFYTGNQLQEAADIMLGTHSGFKNISEILGTNVSTVLQGFGAAALVLNMFIQAASNVFKSQMTKEIWLRYLAQFIAALTLMIYFNQFLDWLCSAGSSFVEFVRQVLEDVVLVNSATVAVENVSGSIGSIGASVEQLEYIMGIMPSIIIQVLTLFVKIVSYAMFFELVLRRAFIPFAIVGILSDGLRNPGVRFFKKIAGMFLRMSIILISLAAVWGIFLSTVSTKDVEITLIDSIGIMMAANVFITKGIKFTDSLLGM